jgi:hypothetical protein
MRRISETTAGSRRSAPTITAEDFMDEIRELRGQLETVLSLLNDLRAEVGTIRENVEG